MDRKAELEMLMLELAKRIRDTENEKERAALRAKLREAARCAGRKDIY
jgi:hypothetical protein